MTANRPATEPRTDNRDHLGAALAELDNIRWDDIWQRVEAFDAVMDDDLGKWSRKYVRYVREELMSAIEAEAAQEAAPLASERLARAIALHREQSSAKAQGCDHNCSPGIAEMYDRLSEWASPRAEGPECSVCGSASPGHMQRLHEEVISARAERDAIAEDEQAAVDELLAAPRAEGLDVDVERLVKMCLMLPEKSPVQQQARKIAARLSRPSDERDPEDQP